MAPSFGRKGLSSFTFGERPGPELYDIRKRTPGRYYAQDHHNPSCGSSAHRPATRLDTDGSDCREARDVWPKGLGRPAAAQGVHVRRQFRIWSQWQFPGDSQPLHSAAPTVTGYSPGARRHPGLSNMGHPTGVASPGVHRTARPVGGAAFATRAASGRTTGRPGPTDPRPAGGGARQC